MLTWLTDDDPFPSLDRALSEPAGLLAASRDIPTARLLRAYHLGIFPWYSPGQPVLWWSPDPRMVLFPQELHLPQSLRKRLRRTDYDIRIDSAFADVIAACAAPRGTDTGTWISDEIQTAYCALHRLGHAHSIETWIGGELAGGLYGVSLGGIFFGESMFTRHTDASKIAFAYLVHHLANQGCTLIDCQMQTTHLARFGARLIPRHEFTTIVQQAVHSGTGFTLEVNAELLTRQTEQGRLRG